MTDRSGRVLPFRRREGEESFRFRSLGLSRRARDYGAPARQLTGHWCRRCAGIWFGYLLEVECPHCGGRGR